MRHLRDITYNKLSTDILTNRKCNIRLKSSEEIIIYKVSKIYNLVSLVRYLYTNSSFSGNRCFYSDICSSKCHLDIIFKRKYLINSDPLLRLQLISCNSRTNATICYSNIYTEAFKCRLKSNSRLSNSCIPSFIIGGSST